MKRYLYVAGSVLLFGALVFGQSGQQSPAGAPTGTKPVEKQTESIAKPVPKKVEVNESMIRAAQQKLADQGYDVSPTGTMDERTRAAVSKYQADSGLPQTGHLDEATLGKLNVGGTQKLAASPSDLARGGKAAGHNVKEGHPIEAGKAVGEGSKNFGKKVGSGVKTEAVNVKDKTGKGISAVGGKISGDKGKKGAEPQEPQAQEPQEPQEPQAQEPQEPQGPQQ